MITWNELATKLEGNINLTDFFIEYYNLYESFVRMTQEERESELNDLKSWYAPRGFDREIHDRILIMETVLETINNK